ncbi:MAG: cytochrome d terminal oxidase subunit 1 [Gammaproteobacteria bacterium CG_4_10_14_0_8_um_filter_38_16]|nr:MAG: cytochrome d terminal oxidase subunit 1 [Gammaproteobacteria bacterium CG_4_10_14_0_8_um_filter_38_16]PJA04347.1 MAG: cytochrome d terminal oxidase subunit 1 [Gammaproteobacteria bacterium CG_4_10_14_0_2_um_filter_38_22]PJB09536.1 MAG: cytochrome d terminal oxidase subunit 1 [Gammaproteobacteria bacterium CG_4_9_14_3_um_filter_38_9]
MLPSLAVVELSRWQFALTALFHFMFVPITLGLTWILVAMEAGYLITGKSVYRDMTQFWGKLLAINFAIGVIGGLTMEFEFGLNWGYFSRMIGGSFGPVLAIEGITAFMLEATMFGLFFFSWDKLSRTAHFIVTFFMAFGASLSIVNILAANSWMQHPISTSFDYQNMTLQLHSIAALYMHHLAQIRIGHVAFAGLFLSSIFVMGISAFYLLKKQDIAFAKRSFAIAVGFGFICSIMVAFYGDQNGLEVSQDEPEKMAAIEAQWQTQKAPASWVAVAWPDQQAQRNYFSVKIPYALSLIATHSLTGTVEGIKPIIKKYEKRVTSGIKSYNALQKIWAKTATPADIQTYQKHLNDLGFAYLLIPYDKNISAATPAQIKAAATSAIPNVPTAFWSFRIMVGLWAILFILIIFGLVFTNRDTLENHPLFLRLCVWAIPLPFICAESGWILAEVGRQPWIIHDIMPVFMGTSSLNEASLITSLVLFCLFYGVLYAVELFLMFKFARKGPSTLHTGKYHFEKNNV